MDLSIVLFLVRYHILALAFGEVLENMSLKVLLSFGCLFNVSTKRYLCYIFVYEACSHDLTRKYWVGVSVSGEKGYRQCKLNTD